VLRTEVTTGRRESETLPRLLGKLLATSESKRRVRIVAGVVFVLVAATNWWLVADEGPSRSRIIAATTATLAAVLDLFFPNRRRLVRRRAEVPDPE
jgi:hypothetical protein